MAQKVIALACAAGMSTSLLVSKMQKAAAEKGKDYEIFAKSTADIDNMLEQVQLNPMFCCQAHKWLS